MLEIADIVDKKSANIFISDFEKLLECGEDVWTTMFSVYDQIDSVDQYPLKLSNLCILEKLDFSKIESASRVLRHFVRLVLGQSITFDGLQTILSDVTDKNISEFFENMKTNFKIYESQLYHLNDIYVAFDQDRRSLLRQTKFRVGLRSVYSMINGSKTSKPIISITFDDDLCFNCTKSDIIFFIDKLNEVLYICPDEIK